MAFDASMHSVLRSLSFYLHAKTQWRHTEQCSRMTECPSFHVISKLFKSLFPSDGIQRLCVFLLCGIYISEALYCQVPLFTVVAYMFRTSHICVYVLYIAEYEKGDGLYFVEIDT